jgi:hypothetical protein
MKPLYKGIFVGAMWRTHVWSNPQAQQEPTPWASILAQEGDHRFQRRLFVEILSSLGRQGNRSACIDKVADFDHMLTLALRTLFR